MSEFCLSCTHGGSQIDDTCDVDGKSLKSRFWRKCDRFNYEPGADEMERPEYKQAKEVKDDIDSLIDTRPGFFKGSKIDHLQLLVDFESECG